jgi:ssDNA-binding Zn-finger/Zn-ribbon topoisomerase 1
MSDNFNDKVYCKVCIRYLLPVNINAHLNVESHLANVNKKKDKSKTRCPICTRPILSKNINKHVLSHQSNNNNEISKVIHYKSLTNHLRNRRYD